jgi:hypothetical protein
VSKRYGHRHVVVSVFSLQDVYCVIVKTGNTCNDCDLNVRGLFAQTTRPDRLCKTNNIWAACL